MEEPPSLSPALGSVLSQQITMSLWVRQDHNRKMHQHSLKHSPCLLCNTLILAFFTAFQRNQSFPDHLLQSRLWLCVFHTGDRQCRVTAASDHQLECVTQSRDKTHTVTNQGFHPGNISLLLSLVLSRTQHLNTSEKREQWLSAQWPSHHVNDLSNTQAARKIAALFFDFLKSYGNMLFIKIWLTLL